MQIKQLSKDNLKYEYSITMDAGEIDTKINDRLQEIGKTVKMPGFRPGKVPMNVLKTKYTQAVMGEVLEKAVDEGVRKAINENELRPAMQPKVEVKDFSAEKGLDCKVEIEVLPEIELMDFSTIKIEKLVATPTDKDVEATMKRIGSTKQDSKPVEKARKSKNGDIVVIDFDGSVDGVKKPGMKADAFHLELGSKSFVDNFEDQLVGAKPGDHVTVNVTFPENYGNKELQGAKAVFEVDVKEIREKVEPEFNDEFAKNFGFDSLDKLKEAIKEQMSGEYDKLSRMDMKKKLLDAMDSKHKFDAPKGMIDAEFFAIWEQLKGCQHPDDPSHHHGEHCNHSDADKGTKKENEEYRTLANRRVKLGLVLAEAGRVNKVEITPQELQQAVIAEARRYPGQEAKVFEFYQKNPHAVESLKAPIYEDKVVDFIISKAQVSNKEVSVEELTKTAEDIEF